MSSSNIDHSLDGQSMSGLIIGLSATLGFFCTIAVITRLYTRAALLRNTGLDDLMIVVTQIIAIGLNVTTCLEAYFGVGKHSWLSSPTQKLEQLECLFAAIHLYVWSLCGVKVSLLLQYRRIFTPAWLQRATLVIICFSVVWNIVQSFLVSFACIPASNIFPSLAPKCLDSLTIWYIACGINMTTDFIVFLLPIPLIKSLQLPIRQRILLIGVFCLGFFTCIISIVRATVLHLGVLTDDASWYGTPAAIWSMLEVNCAILCACLPTIRHLVALWLPCLGLRSQPSQYYAEDQLRSSKRRASALPLQSNRKSVAAGGGPGSRGLGISQSKGRGGANNVGKICGSNNGKAHAELDTRHRWGNDPEDPGVHYHNNSISAWVSTCTDQKSPTFAKPTPSEDKCSDMHQVSHEGPEMGFGQNILVTREMVVEEGRTSRLSALDSGPLLPLQGRAL